MITARTIPDVKMQIQRLKEQRNQDATVGFVPTMGFLHEGHISLLKQAKLENDIVVLSIFVNPLQFGPNEDFDRYPRDEKQDLHLAQSHGVDIVFIPEVSEMYPKLNFTKVIVSDLTKRLCGASRPGHFDGVTTIVSKLFHVIQPDFAYFGQKDIQQVAVIQQMVQDLNFNLRIRVCNTVREADGLALSSRNVYLSPEERAQAVVLSEALQRARQIAATEPHITIDDLKNRLQSLIHDKPLARLEYVEVVTYPQLTFVNGTDTIQTVLELENVVIVLAVRFGTTRLIDNEWLGGGASV